MGKTMKYDEAALLALKRGVEKMAQAVKVTLGPKGRQVVIEENSYPVSTKDGVTVAKAIELEDPFEQEGAALVREVCLKTDELAGDGTTTSIILAEKLLGLGIRYIVAGVDGCRFVYGLEDAVKKVTTAIRASAKPVSRQKEVEQIATVAANDDPHIAGLITQLYNDQKLIPLQIEEGNTVDDELEIIDGTELPCGFSSREFMNDTQSQTCELQDALVLLTDEKMNSIQDILPLLTQLSDVQKPLLLIAPRYDNVVLSLLVNNHKNNALHAVALRVPFTGELQKEWLEDIALLVRTSVISAAKGDQLKKVTIDKLGTVERLTAHAEKTVLTRFPPASEALKKRISTLTASVKEEKKVKERQKLEERLALLNGKVAHLYLGNVTPTAAKEKRYRVEDAYYGVKAALEEGVVAGGGIAFIRAAQQLNINMVDRAEDKLAIKVLQEVLQTPFKILLQNAGETPSAWIGKISKAPNGTGYNLQTRQMEDFFEAGIIDPVKCLRLALENALSITTMLLLTKCAVAEQPEYLKNKTT